MESEPQNVAWVIEWRRTNGTCGQKWKMREVYLDRPKAMADLKRARILAAQVEPVRGWVVQYQLVPYTRAVGELGAILHT